jgi:flagellar hook-associated protein 2
VGSGTATSISIAANATVQDVIDAINAEGIDATAFLVDNGQGSVRIAIVGDKTGSANDLTISNSIGQTYTRTQAGQNARITLDPDSVLPIAVESASNSFQNVIQGLTIEVKTATATGERVTVSVDTNTSEVREQIQKVVDAYNAIADVIRSQNTVDPNTNRGGPLLGDSALVDLAQALSGSLARQYGDGSVKSTAQMGIELTREGKLEIRDQVLSDALESDFEGVADFFAGAGQFADSFREVLDRIVDPTDGTLTSRIEGTNERIAQLRLSITRAEERLESFESNLVRQFAALERTLSQFQEQSNFLASYLTSVSR